LGAENKMKTWQKILFLTPHLILLIGFGLALYFKNPWFILFSLVSASLVGAVFIAYKVRKDSLDKEDK